MGETMMQALVFRGKKTIAKEEVPMPRLEQPSDVIVKITLCGLCGSDMHPYHCRENVDVGTIMGHEFVGSVHEKGSEVSCLNIGDKVMSPFTTCCGSCFYCRSSLPARCDHGQIFGVLQGGKGLQGAQAQYIRVPLADSTLIRVPEGISDETALLLGDICSTGFYAVYNSNLEFELQKRGDETTIAIVGCGPVGLMAVLAARTLGGKQILAIDGITERLEAAKLMGATSTIALSADTLHAVKNMTDGRGADIVIEAVGLPPAFESACELVRCGGTISVAGCHAEATLPLVTLYDKNLTIKSGRCPARFYMEKLLEILPKMHIEPTAVITHRLPLTPDAYTLFDSKSCGCLKVVMSPW